MSFLEILEYSSVFIFALTGALVASRAQLDPVGFLFIAALTAVGGGTVRDLLLDRNPLFWIDKPIVLVIAAVAAMITFFTAHLLESRLKTLTWLDAAALAVAVPAGVGVAVREGRGLVAAQHRHAARLGAPQHRLPRRRDSVRPVACRERADQPRGARYCACHSGGGDGDDDDHVTPPGRPSTARGDSYGGPNGARVCGGCHQQRRCI